MTDPSKRAARLEWIRNKLKMNVRVVDDDVAWLLAEYDELAARTQAVLDDADRNRAEGRARLASSRWARFLRWVWERTVEE